MTNGSTQPTRILVIGRGGREHALAWKLASEPGVNDVFVTNAGRAITAQPHVHQAPANPLSPAAIIARARELAVELVVIGPEAPLAAGVADALIDARIPVFGPTAAGARIETSKAFCREIAEGAGVPMAEGRSFGAEERQAARRYAADLVAEGGAVVKADGLAAGKGVSVCQSTEEVEAAFQRIDGPIVVEARLSGREASVIAVCDGRAALALPVARDHKRLGDGDTGPNTGGMGAYSPVADLSDDAVVDIIDQFHAPVLAELAKRGTPFRGALYAGLMLTDDGPRLLEFNARFGDPETQVILPRLATPLGPLLAAAASGSIAARINRDGSRVAPTLPIATVGIVLANPGYPGDAELGARITALDLLGQLPDKPDVTVFHSGTFHEEGPTWLATGGRVLTVVGRGADLPAARAVAEDAADRLAWPGAQRRHDIALDSIGVPA